MFELYRVKDTTTGHQYTTALVEAHHEVLEKPAVDEMGVPLPAKPNLNFGAAAPAEPYAKQTVAELEASVAERNVGRGPGDVVVVEGDNKADLVAALQADDEVNPPGLGVTPDPQTDTADRQES